jgi:hypothetical protein
MRTTVLRVNKLAVRKSLGYSYYGSREMVLGKPLGITSDAIFNIEEEKQEITSFRVKKWHPTASKNDVVGFLLDNEFYSDGAYVGSSDTVFLQNCLVDSRLQNFIVVSDLKELIDAIQTSNQLEFEKDYLPRFRNHSFYWVYLDLHNKEQLTTLLFSWYSKVKPGGVLLVPKDFPYLVKNFAFSVKACLRSDSDFFYLWKPYTFVCSLTDNYVEAFVTLVYSMIKNAQLPFRFVVFSKKPLSVFSVNRISNLHCDIEFAIMDSNVSAGKQVNHERHLFNLDRLKLLGLDLEGPVCHIDSDIICLSSIKGIEKLTHFSAVRDYIAYLFTKATTPRGMWFNAGWFIFNPSKELRDGVIDNVKTFSGVIYAGDQPVISDYFQRYRFNEVQLIPRNWNWEIHTFPFFKEEVADNIVFLHYADDLKPWEDRLELSKPSYHWSCWLTWKRYNKEARQYLGEL